MSLQEFDSRVVWLSVWTQASLAHNDFLGEINISLANCLLDNLQEYTLQPRIQEENVICLIRQINSYFFRHIVRCKYGTNDRHQ